MRQAEEHEDRLGDASAYGPGRIGEVLPREHVAGFLERLMKDAIKEGIRTMPKTDAVQNQGDGSMVQPASARSVNAGDTSERLRLSKIFQRDSGVRGFFRKRALGPGTPGNSHLQKLPIPPNPASAATHVGVVS